MEWDMVVIKKKRKKRLTPLQKVQAELSKLRVEHGKVKRSLGGLQTASTKLQLAHDKLTKVHTELVEGTRFAFQYMHKTYEGKGISPKGFSSMGMGVIKYQTIK